MPIAPDSGLGEGVGQQLEPAADTQNSPLKVHDGQWAFRFDYADLSKIGVYVTVSFGPPFSYTADLSSEMNQTQVESLIGWLTRVHEAMKNPR